MNHQTTKPAKNNFFEETELALNHCANIAALAELLGRANPVETPEYVILTGGMIKEETEILRDQLTNLLRELKVSR